MPVLNLSDFEARINSAIAAANHAGHQLYQRRENLTETGLRAEWDRLSAEHREAVAKFKSELTEINNAASKIEGYERDQLLQPTALGNPAEEAAVARLMQRPSFGSLETFADLIRPHLGTRVAGLITQEVQARNTEVTDEFISAVLAQESSLFEDAMTVVNALPTAIGQLRTAVNELEKATRFEVSVNGHPIDGSSRPGAYLQPIAVSGLASPIRISTEGNLHV